MKRLVSALVVALALWAQPASAQIAFDAVSGINNTGFTSWSHTVTGTNTILLVGIESRFGQPTGVTYNSVAMTLLAARSDVSDMSVYYLFAPTTGTNTIALSFSSAPSQLFTAAVSYSGVLQSGLDNSSNASGGATSPHSASITPVADSCWVTMFTFAFSGLAAGTGTTSRVVTGARDGWFDNNAAVSPAASTTLQYTWDQSVSSTVYMVTLAPFGGAPPPSSIPCNLKLLGVGCDAS